MQRKNGAILEAHSLNLDAIGFYWQRCALHHSVLLASTDAGMRMRPSSISNEDAAMRMQDAEVRAYASIRSTGFYWCIVRC